MATVNLTKDNFEQIVSFNDTVFLGIVVRTVSDVLSTFEKASEQHPDLVFAKVDTEAEQELAQGSGSCP